MNWNRLAGGFVCAALMAYGCGGGGTGPTTSTPPPSATLSSVAISGASTVSVGSTIALGATARFSDNSTQTVTATSTWSSSATGVATVSGDGVVSGVSAGSATITASFQGMLSAPFAVQVTAVAPPTATLSSVTVTGTSSVQVGNTTPLVATARFSDNSTQVVTSSSTWASSSNGVATVSNVGVVTGVSAGSANITATYQGMASNAFSMQVTPQSVQAVITVFPTNAADGNENTCPVIPQSPSGQNKLDCKFDSVGSQPAGSILSYKWTIPLGSSNTFTQAVLQGQTVACGTLSGISVNSTREVELTITAANGATSTVRKSVTFTKANPC